jgi:hypothetical protein
MTPEDKAAFDAWTFKRSYVEGGYTEPTNLEIWQAALEYARQQPKPVRLTDEEMEALRHKTFSTSNPFCPCDSRTFRKAGKAIMDACGAKDAQLLVDVLRDLIKTYHVVHDVGDLEMQPALYCAENALAKWEGK